MRKDCAMKYTFVCPPGVWSEARAYLREASRDGRESYAVILCGRHVGAGETRFLAKRFIALEPGCYEYREAAGLRLKRAVDMFLAQFIDEQGLDVVHLHTHPGHGHAHFSKVDDLHERKYATFLRSSLRRRPWLLSLVADRGVRNMNVRLWVPHGRGMRTEPVRLSGGLLDDLKERVEKKSTEECSKEYDRQVRAFGEEGQRMLGELHIGLVGCGGLGAVLVELLSRLGVRRWTLVDDDIVDVTNLNRLTGALHKDALERISKVTVAERHISRLHGPRARVRAFRSGIEKERAAKAIAAADVIAAATDNHASRVKAQEIANRYMRPLVNIGVDLERSEKDREQLGHIVGRVTVPPVDGGWCLVCEGLIDPVTAAEETADEETRSVLKARGYLEGTPAPAVYWVNAMAASLAAGVVHNLVGGFARSVSDRMIDMLGGEILDISHERREGCLWCGREGYLGSGDLTEEEHCTSSDTDGGSNGDILGWASEKLLAVDEEKGSPAADEAPMADWERR